MRDRRAYLTLGYKWFERITVIRAFCYQNGTLSVISLQRQSRNVRRRMRIIKKRKKTCIFIKRVQQLSNIDALINGKSFQQGCLTLRKF